MAYVNPLLAPEGAQDEVLDIAEHLDILERDFRKR